jgi:primosomal protein N'
MSASTYCPHCGEVTDGIHSCPACQERTIDEQAAEIQRLRSQLKAFGDTAYEALEYKTAEGQRLALLAIYTAVGQGDDT